MTHAKKAFGKVCDELRLELPHQHCASLRLLSLQLAESFWQLSGKNRIVLLRLFSYILYKSGCRLNLNLILSPHKLGEYEL